MPKANAKADAPGDGAACTVMGFPLIDRLLASEYREVTGSGLEDLPFRVLVRRGLLLDHDLALGADVAVEVGGGLGHHKVDGIAGAGRGSFNIRFAQPSRDGACSHR